jgi:hypothetical protein
LRGAGREEKGGEAEDVSGRFARSGSGRNFSPKSEVATVFGFENAESVMQRYGLEKAIKRQLKDVDYSRQCSIWYSRVTYRAGRQFNA